MLEGKDSSFSSSCQVVPSISQDRRDYTLYTSSPDLYRDNYANFLPNFARQQIELDSLELPGLSRERYASPQPRPQDDTSNESIPLTQDDEHSLQENNVNQTGTVSSTLTSMVSSDRTKMSDESEFETILDILCEERNYSCHQTNSGTTDVVDAPDSEMCIIDEDIFNSRDDDIAESNWLKEL